jgi:tetratricopeptide (TPR) repeat protein
MKKEYEKKIRNKKLYIKHSKYDPAVVMEYDEAIALVRNNRNSGRYQVGQFYLEQIYEQVKNIPEPAAYLMNVYLDSKYIDEAGALAEQLLRKFPRDNMILRNCAKFYQQAEDFERGLELIKKAISLNPKNSDNHVMLGVFFQSIGDKDNAIIAFKNALKCDSGNPAAILDIARMQKGEASSQFVEKVEQLISSGTVSEGGRADLHYALSWIFESTDVDKHFAHLNEANRIVAINRPFFPAQHAQRAEQLIEKFSASWTSSAQGVSTEAASPIVIAALARSGTTLLEQMLSGHSKLHALGESAALGTTFARESVNGNALIKATDWIETENVQQCIEAISARYRTNYFVRKAQSLRTVDKSIGNYEHIGMILTVYPKAKIIDLQRHPLDIIYSCYKQKFAAGNNYSFNLEWSAHNYLVYEKIMEHWRLLYPDQILSISYENLVDDQEAVLKKVLDFCGLEWEEACIAHHKNVGLVNTASEEQVRQPVHKRSVGGWRRVERHLEVAASVLSKSN